MRASLARLTVVCVSVIVVSVMFQDTGYAKINPDALVGAWLFEDSKGRVKGGVVPDSSGNGHDGEVMGILNIVDGKFGNAMQFPGSTDHYIKVPHHDSLNLTTYSITVWVKVEVKDRQCVMRKGTSAPTNYGLWVKENTGLSHTSFTSANNWKGILGTSVLTDGQWHHIAATYDQKSLRLYVDGVLETESSYTDEPDANGEALRIGSDGSGGVNGLLDDVGIFDEALTEGDIEVIINNGLGEIAFGAAILNPITKLTATWGAVKAQDKY